MQDRLINYSEENNLNDRDPAFDFSTPTTMEEVQNSSENYKKMLETMEKFQTLSRKQKRQIIKPSFSNQIKRSFRKPIEK